MLVIVCVLAPCVVAEKRLEHDADFGFSVIRDVAYVDRKLDRSADLRIMDIYHPDTPDQKAKKDPRASFEGLAPIVLYIHGGGWAFGDKADVNVKPHFFTRHGFGFVSINYRLRWDYKVYDQVVDVVAAIRWLGDNAKQYGLDGRRIILMGHGSGGHLASLVTADSSYFLAEEMDGSQIVAVVSIDSSSYDIARLMRELGSFVERRQHELIFTGDENVWRAASPITHVSESKTLPPHALLYNAERDGSMLQARGYAKALAEAGVEVVMIPGSNSEPERIDELIGTSGNIATGALMAFLRSQI